MMSALFWLIFSSSLIGFGYMIISKILNNKKDEEDKSDAKDETDTKNTEN